MKQEELDRSYRTIEERLKAKYWLISRDRMMFTMGALMVFLLFTVGGSWVAAKAAISTSAGAIAAREIENLRQEATTNAQQVASTLASVRSDNLVRTTQAITILESAAGISFKVPQDDGDIRFERRGKVLWYPTGGGPKNGKVIFSGF